MNILSGHIKETETSHGSVSGEEGVYFAERTVVTVDTPIEKRRISISDSSIDYELGIAPLGITGYQLDTLSSDKSVSDEYEIAHDIATYKTVVQRLDTDLSDDTIDYETGIFAISHVTSQVHQFELTHEGAYATYGPSEISDQSIDDEHDQAFSVKSEEGDISFDYYSDESDEKPSEIHETPSEEVHETNIIQYQRAHRGARRIQRRVVNISPGAGDPVFVQYTLPSRPVCGLFIMYDIERSIEIVEDRSVSSEPELGAARESVLNISGISSHAIHTSSYKREIEISDSSINFEDSALDLHTESYASPRSIISRFQGSTESKVTHTALYRPFSVPMIVHEVISEDGQSSYEEVIEVIEVISHKRPRDTLISLNSPRFIKEEIVISDDSVEGESGYRVEIEETTQQIKEVTQTHEALNISDSSVEYEEALYILKKDTEIQEEEIRLTITQKQKRTTRRSMRPSHQPSELQESTMILSGSEGSGYSEEFINSTLSGRRARRDPLQSRRSHPHDITQYTEDSRIYLFQDQVSDSSIEGERDINQLQKDVEVLESEEEIEVSTSTRVVKRGTRRGVRSGRGPQGTTSVPELELSDTEE